MEEKKLHEDGVAGAGSLEATSVIKKRGLPQIPRRWAIVSAAVLVLVAISIFALISGRLVVFVKSPTQKVVVSEAVCGDAVIQNYNAAIGAYYKGDTNQLDALSTMVNDFSKDASYTKDANCMFIKYQLGILKTDYATAKSAADVLKQLFNEGKSASGNLNGLVGADGMDAQLNVLQPSNDEDQYVD